MKTLTKFTIGFFAALFAYASYAAPVEIKFGTGNITVQNDFAAVLNNSGINYQQGISGNFYYENSTADSNSTAVTGQYNGTVNSLSFSVGSWFSQSLTNIGNNGDIRVRDNTGTGNGVLDDIRVQVVCDPALNNTTRPFCTGNLQNPPSGQFNYFFTDPTTSINWVLDSFTLTLTQNPPGAGLPALLSSDALPAQSQWESSAWTARQVQLRFNPYGIDASGNAIPNENAAGLITFLAVPEPGSLMLVALALLIMGAVRYQKGRKK